MELPYAVLGDPVCLDTPFATPRGTYVLRECVTEEGMRELFALQERVVAEMANPHRFAPDTLDFWRESLATGGRLVAALRLEDTADGSSEDESRKKGVTANGAGTDGSTAKRTDWTGAAGETPVGFFLSRYPGPDFFDNLGLDLAAPDSRFASSLDHRLLVGLRAGAAHLETVCVDPAHGGGGLATRMGRWLAREAAAAGRRALFATVWPWNEPSLALLRGLGLVVCRRTRKYGDRDRYVMVARLDTCPDVCPDVCPDAR